MPKGNPDGGQWTRVAGDVPGIGRNQGPPLGDPPQVPKTKPATEKIKNDFLKAAAKWVTRARAVGARVAPFIAAYEAMSWLDTDRPYIEAYQDPPKTLEELQGAAQGLSQRGYNTHHVVEQTAAEKAGFSRSMIDARDNLVRIPAIKHWEITGWYMQPNPAYQDLSPRDYLRDKPWDERRKVGLEALRRFGVLKP